MTHVDKVIRLQKRAAILSKYERLYPFIYSGLSAPVYAQARGEGWIVSNEIVQPPVKRKEIFRLTINKEQK